MKTVLAFAAGAAATVALLLSCSDDSPSGADAAGPCEPPLSGRINRVEDLQTAQVGDPLTAIASCPEGRIVLGGGCEIRGQMTNQTVLLVSGGDGVNSYDCQWANPNAIVAEEVRAWAICLTPAPP